MVKKNMKKVIWVIIILIILALGLLIFINLGEEEEIFGEGMENDSGSVDGDSLGGDLGGGAGGTKTSGKG